MRRTTPLREGVCDCDTRAAVCGRCIYCGRLKENEMARRAKQVQKRIEGTYDQVPHDVQALADEFMEAKRAVTDNRETMNAKRVDLVEKMQEYDVTELTIDDGDKRLILTNELKLQVKRIKKPKDGEAGTEE
jgi:hypothetical protein